MHRHFKTSLAASGIFLFLSLFSQAYGEPIVPGLSEDSMQDHKAQIFNVIGSVQILKSGAMVQAQKGMMIDEGDQILTSKDSYLEITYDKNFLNIARIEANTKAEFRSIEPTELHLEDGTIFNALDGLKITGGKYSVSTPTAVAAVRGTHFDVMFDAQTQVMDAAVLPDTQPHISELEITPLLTGGQEGNSFLIQEGQQVGLGPENMNAGNQPAPENISPEHMDHASETLNQMMDQVDPNLRSEGEGLIAVSPESPAAESKLAEGENVEMQDDSSQKPAGDGNPPDGGNQGGDASQENRDPNILNSDPVENIGADEQLTDTGLSADAGKPSDAVLPAEAGKPADVDALADALIPREDIATEAGAAPAERPQGSDMNQNKKYEGESSNANPANSPDQQKMGNGMPLVMHDPTAGPNGPMNPNQGPQRIDFGQMMEFLSTGGAFNGGPSNAMNPMAHADATHLNFDMSGFLGSMGYQPDASQKMAEHFETMVNFMTGAHQTEQPGGSNMPAFGAPGGMPMDPNMMAGNMPAFGTPGGMPMDPSMMAGNMPVFGAPGGMPMDPNMMAMMGKFMEGNPMNPGGFNDFGDFNGTFFGDGPHMGEHADMNSPFMDGPNHQPFFGPGPMNFEHENFVDTSQFTRDFSQNQFFNSGPIPLQFQNPDFLAMFINERNAHIFEAVDRIEHPLHDHSFLEHALSNAGYVFSPPQDLILTNPNISDNFLKINDIDYVDGSKAAVNYEIHQGATVISSGTIDCTQTACS